MDGKCSLPEAHSLGLLWRPTIYSGFLTSCQLIPGNFFFEIGVCLRVFASFSLNSHGPSGCAVARIQTMQVLVLILLRYWFNSIILILKFSLT